MTTNEAYAYLYNLVTETFAGDLDILGACYQVLDNPKLHNGYGSFEKHHSYKGALLIHIAEVMQNALAMASSDAISPRPDLQVLIAAILFHDVMKIRDYDNEGKETDYKKKIYHIAGSYADWVKRTDHVKDRDFVDAVGHCILAHHGRRDWKSCVEPQTVEAWIIHFADMLSAGYGKGREAN